jgi:hypothetical protein
MLTDLVEDKMKLNRKTQTHIQDCDSCSTQAQWVRQITAAIYSRDLVDAPEFVVSRAVSAFQRKAGSWVQIVKAVLRFDSWAEPIAAGVRSQDPSPRQLMYQTEAYNIFLMLLPAPDSGSVVLGQLVPTRPKLDPAGRTVELKRNKRVLSQVKTNAAGEFYLKARRRKPADGSRAADSRCIDLLIYKDSESILLSDIAGTRM